MSLATLLLTSVLAIAPSASVPVEASDPVAADSPPAAPARVGAVTISLVGVSDAAPFETAIEARLAPHGVVPFITVERDFAPLPATTASDNLADVWIVVAGQGQMRIVAAHPGHDHIVVRQIPIAAAPSIVSIEEAAIIVEEAVAMALDGTWPRTEQPPGVAITHVEPPPEPAAVEPDPEPSVRRGRHPRGFSIGMSAGAAIVSDEFGDARFGLPALTRLGWVFGGPEDHPDLRASVHANCGWTELFVPGYESYSLLQFMVESRVGITRGPAWVYGVAGLGAGQISRRLKSDARETKTSGGVLATLGAGVSVRVHRRFAVYVEAAASGNASRVGRLSIEGGLSAYFGRTTRKETQ
ncbi:MAG: hypothetical protein AAF721_39425 [Myxococcota bacterium]